MEISELGMKPISEASPTGVPSRDDPAFEALQTEFRKLELPEQPAVDWAGAIQNATGLLGGKSKDVLVGVYLAIALFERDGYEGFVAGLAVLHDMASGFWETMHPERVRPRQTAFQYLGDRGGKRVALRGPDGVQHATAKRVVELVDQLDALLSEKLEGGSGLLSELRREMGGVLDQAAPAAAAAPAPSAAPSAAVPGGASAPTLAPLPTSVGSEADFEESIKSLRPALRQLGEFLRTTRPRDPMAYRLPRIALWLTAVMPKDPPRPERADALPRLEALLGAQKWAGILEETEGLMARATYWLDLHYFAFTALRGMGPDFVPAAEAVAGEVRMLLQRLPGLAELTFAGGMPLANDATRAWIRDSVMSGGGGGGGGARPAGGLELALSAEGGEPEGLAEARTQSAELMVQGRLADAVKLFEAGAARAVRARERAAWRVALARLCADAGRHDVALAQLEGLNDDLQSTTLEAWDPELASTMLRLMLTARAKAVPAGAGADEHQKTRELLRRLARLDAAAALEFQRPAQ